MRQYTLSFGHQTGGQMTLGEYAGRWFQTRCATPFRAEYLCRIRRNSFRLYLLPRLGNVALKDVDTALLSELQQELLGRGLSVVTVRTAIGHFSEMWKAARADGLVRGRPHSDLVWPRMKRRKPTVFTPYEREQLVTAAKGRWFLPQIALMAYAGLRPSEAAGMRWEDFDPIANKLSLRQALVAREETDGKTGKSLRVITISPKLTRLLVEAKGNRMVGPMSRNNIGEPINSEHFAGKYFRPLCRDIGLKYRSPYAMRHTFITIALMEGASAAHVAEYCGTSIQEIERSYLSWIGVVADPMAEKAGPARAVQSTEHVSTRGLAGFQR